MHDVLATPLKGKGETGSSFQVDKIRHFEVGCQFLCFPRALALSQVPTVGGWKFGTFPVLARIAAQLVQSAQFHMTAPQTCRPS